MISRRIIQIQIRNYKSIGQAVVDLSPLTVLVGPNGAGKSNFLDAIAFLQECLSDSVELAFKNRGGIGAVRRRSAGHPTHIGIRVDMALDADSSASYAFEIAAKPTERFRIARERCEVRSFMKDSQVFEVQDGRFKKEIPGIRPKVTTDRLALFAASATEEFRPVYDFLTSMRFYSIVPIRLRELQEPDPGDYLKRDGRNAAAVLKRLSEVNQGKRYDRLCRLLATVVQGIERVEYQPVGQKETIQFKQDVGLKHPWTFDSLNMSDGTLRVLGLLLAVYQAGEHSVVAIEEPESTVHPAVAESIVEVLMDAAQEKQILFTTHSPDIIDHKEITDEQIRVVTMERNETLIAPLSDSSRDAIRKQLYTPGELLRTDELNPDVTSAKQEVKQLNLFSAMEQG
ncbi:MAG: AAA family ATPase [Candidatus Brocadiia bacterium]